MTCEAYCDLQRSFLTREERIEMLKEYKKTLDNESQAVSERIEEIQNKG